MIDKLSFDSNSLRELQRAIAEGFSEGNKRTGVKIEQVVTSKYTDKSGKEKLYTQDRITLPHGETLQGKNAALNIHKLIQGVSASSAGGSAGASFIGSMGKGAGIGVGFMAAEVLGEAVTTATGVSSIKKAFDDFFNPSITSTPLSGASISVGAYKQGKYCINLVFNAPTDYDLQALDNYFIWNGITVNEIDRPLIYTEGEVKSQKDGSIVSVKVRAQNKFQYIKTEGAVVNSKNRLAAVQMQEMLNGGFRWWQI